MLTKSQSSWAAISLAIQSQERDWWHTVAHTVKSGSTLQRLTALIVGEAEFCAEVDDKQIGRSLKSVHMDLG